MPPTVREAVVGLWRASTTGLLERCQLLYVQAAALGLLGHEPYLGVVREANGRWLEAVVDQLCRAGCPPRHARSAAFLVVATFMGLHLDLPLTRDDPSLDRAVTDLADAVSAIAAS